MSGTHLEITTDRQAYQPGDQVSGTVEVLEAYHAKSLTLALEYRDSTVDYRSLGRAVPLDSPLHLGDLEQGQTFSFTVAIPADALPNQSGKYGKTSWGLHAQIERFGPDAHAWHGLSVHIPDRASRV